MLNSEATIVKTRKIKPKKLALQLGVTLLLVLFLWRMNLNLGQIGRTLWDANEWLVLSSVLLILPILGLKAWRWQLIMRDLGIKVSRKEAFRLYALGLSAGSFTPGQIGDAIKAFYLRDKGFSFGSALLSVALDRLFDLAALGLLATAGLAFLGTTFLGELPVVLLFLAGVTLVLLALSLPGLRKKGWNLLKKFLLRKQAANGEPITLEIQRSKLGLPFVITLITAALASGRIWLLALAIGLNLQFLEALTSSSLATVAGLLPISVAGVGTRDFTLVAVLGQIGYAAEPAISLSALILLLNLVNLVIGYILWLLTKEK